MSDSSQEPAVTVEDAANEYERERIPESKTRGFGRS